jgi:hypothetical protein
VRQSRLHRRVRKLAAGALIGFGLVIAVGGLFLLPALVQRLDGARGRLAPAAALPCRGEVRPRPGQGCASPLPGRDISVVAATPAAAVEPLPALLPALAWAPEPTEPELPPAAPMLQPAAGEAAAAAPGSGVSLPPPPVALARQPRSAARTALEARAPPTPARRTARHDSAARRPGGQALHAVRGPGGGARGLALRARAAGGGPRTIVIRPTSVQDVYYYSVPR